MPVHTLSWAVRSSGRDYRVVRRPTPSVPAASVDTLKKAELVALAEERGLDTSGTKADIVERLTSNDADVTTTDV